MCKRLGTAAGRVAPGPHGNVALMRKAQLVRRAQQIKLQHFKPCLPIDILLAMFSNHFHSFISFII